VTKCIVTFVEFFPDVARQKLLKSANAAHSYSKIKMVRFMDHGVHFVISAKVFVCLDVFVCFRKNEIIIHKLQIITNFVD